MRSCDCEYTQDGRCAYTLLLPLTSGDSAVCPTTPPAGDDDDVTTSSNTTSPELARRITELSDSVTRLDATLVELMTTSGDQSRMLSQLQSKVMEHSDQLTMLERQVRSDDNNNNMTSHDDVVECHACDDMDAQIAVNTQYTAQLSAQLADIAANVSDIQAQLDALRNDTRVTQNLTSRVDSLNSSLTAKQSELRQDVDSLDARLKVLQCVDKGLLVSGVTSRIDDAAISASSEQDSATVATRVRVHDAVDATAWCAGGTRLVLIQTNIWLCQC